MLIPTVKNTILIYEILTNSSHSTVQNSKRKRTCKNYIPLKLRCSNTILEIGPASPVIYTILCLLKKGIKKQTRYIMYCQKSQKGVIVISPNNQ